MLLIFFAPLLIASIAAFLKGEAPASRDTWQYVNSIVHEIGGLSLLAYILSRSGRGWRDLGFQFTFGQLGVGVVLCVAFVMLAWFVYYILEAAQYSLFHTWIKPWDLSGVFGTTSAWVLVPFVLLNPWFEEGIVRGYVMTELRGLTGSSVVAVLGSTILQIGYHLYQGPVNAVMVGVGFLLLSVFYARTKKLLPVIVSHTAIDVISVLMFVYRAKGH